MASAHCLILYCSPTLFSLVQVYASELVNSISVCLPAAAKIGTAARRQRKREKEKGKEVKTDLSVRLNSKYLSHIGHTQTHALKQEIKSKRHCRNQIDNMIPGCRLVWNFLNTCRPEIISQDNQLSVVAGPSVCVGGKTQMKWRKDS